MPRPEMVEMSTMEESPSGENQPEGSVGTTAAEG